VLALTQLYYLHRGLKLVSTSVLYPLVFCIYNIIAILDGLIYFNQADQLSALHACLVALGTVILLSGVLALSWRLSDEQTQPAVAQSALAPGLGLVEDTDNEEYSDSYNADEESTIRAEHQALLSGEPMTPTTKFDTVLGATRRMRKSERFTEADEIWGELQDHDAKVASPSPRSSRRPSTTLPLPAVQGGDEEADETTALLRSSTFSRRRRRRSTGFPGFTARPSPRGSKRKSSQGALGGFWKMSWWKRGDGDRRPPDPGPGSGGGGDPNLSSNTI
jgi:hypothetical protein